jgi:RNA polymerase sigma factor (sigma-70 family)
VPDSTQDEMIMDDLIPKPVASDDFSPRAVLSFARLVLGGRGRHGADLDDLVQEVALTVALRRPSYRADLGTPRQWMRGVIANTLHEWRRRSGRVLGELVRELPELPVESNAEALVHARRRLTAVPAAERRVLRLVAAGHTMRDVAVVERISPSTASERYRRGLRSLQRGAAEPDGRPHRPTR